METEYPQTAEPNDQLVNRGLTRVDLNTPSKNRIKDTRIEELSRGFVVRVGCQAFAFSTKDELLDRLFEYIRDPDKTEAKWNNGNLF